MKPPRRRCRFGRRRDLVERLAPYVQRIDPEPELLVSVEPIRWWLEGWGAATGDRPEMIARGFGIDQSLVLALLAGDLGRITATDGVDLCDSLGLEFAIVWPFR